MQRYTTAILLALVFLAVCGQPTLRLSSFEGVRNEPTDITRLLKDNCGLIWSANATGLYRFDGTTFMNFRMPEGEGEKLKSNNITALYKSLHGNLWCLIDGRAVLFNTSTYRFTDVFDNFEEDHHTTCTVRKIRTLANGHTWLATDDGRLFLVADEQKPAELTLSLPEIDVAGLTVLSDKHGRSWLMTGNKTYVSLDKGLHEIGMSARQMAMMGQTVILSDDAGQLYCYDEQQRKAKSMGTGNAFTDVKLMSTVGNDRLLTVTATGTYLVRSSDRQATPLFIGKQVAKVVKVTDSHLWLTDSEGNLHRIDLATGKQLTIDGFHGKDAYIHTDAFGTTWLFADNGEVFVCDEQARLFTPYTSLPDNADIGRVALSDGRGDLWTISNKRIKKLTFGKAAYSRSRYSTGEEPRFAMTDSKGRIWTLHRYTQHVTVFDRQGDKPLFLTPQWTLSDTPADMGFAPICMMQDSKGTIWIGTREHGLYRLKELTDGTFATTCFTTADKGPYSLCDNKIYDMLEDHLHRLWLATDNGGLCCMEEPQGSKPRFVHQGNGLKGYRPTFCKKVFCLMLTADRHLLAGTAAGLYIADISKGEIGKTVFHEHLREASRHSSLSSSGINAMVADSRNRIFISTLGGGVNEITDTNLDADKLKFRHYDTTNGLSTDQPLAITVANDALWIVAADHIAQLKANGNEQFFCNTYLRNDHLKFSHMLPLRLSDGSYLLATDDGAITTRLDKLSQNGFQPPIVVTGIHIDGHYQPFAPHQQDTITLAPGQRHLTVGFAAVDFSSPRDICYAFSFDGQPWTHISTTNSVTLANLEPGRHGLQLRSTNGEGLWADNTHAIVIIVKPTFWQTIWAKLLILLLLAAVAAAVIYTYGYLQRMKRQQREATERYLAMLDENRLIKEKAEQQASQVMETAFGKMSFDKDLKVPDEDKVFMQHLMAFIEENLSNGEVRPEDMAQATMTSRSNLARKMDKIVGMSPMEFMRQARMRHACNLLSSTNLNVTEVAYACGFNDPKYFSKSFRAQMDMTPSAYRAKYAR